MRLVVAIAALAMALCVASPPRSAFAQKSAAEPDSKSQVPDQVSGAAEWDEAPRPDQAHGIAEGNEQSDGWLWVPRAIFFVPKWAFFIAASPLRLTAYLYERYQLPDRFDRMFFNDTGTVGFFPVAFFETGFGLNAGVRFIHKDLFGERERLRLRLGYGGRYRQLYSAQLTSGDRLGKRVTLDLRGDFEIRAQDTFYGIGNADEVDDDTITMPADARAGDVAVISRFRQQVTRTVLTADFALGGPLHARISGHLMWRSFEIPDDDDLDDDLAIDQAYTRDSLVGFDSGLNNLYTELELRYDTRRRTNIYLTNAVPAAGWLISGWAGRASGFGDDPSSYTRVGMDVQRYINLYRGTRILGLRVFAENLLGELDNIPFVDLPPLGGGLLLRGYALDRFRDRASVVASAEYSYDLGPNFAGVLFVDTGGVFRKLRDAELDDLRLGFGGGLQVHTGNSFMARFTVASSVDGGLFFSLGFDPVHNTRTRAGRY